MSIDYTLVNNMFCYSDEYAVHCEYGTFQDKEKIGYKKQDMKKSGHEKKQDMKEQGSTSHTVYLKTIGTRKYLQLYIVKNINYTPKKSIKRCSPQIKWIMMRHIGYEFSEIFTALYLSIKLVCRFTSSI